MDPNVLQTVLSIVAMIGAFALPIMVIVGLLRLSKRRLEGRRSRLDGLFGGVARGGVMGSHLQAGTPHPDDIAVPVPSRRDTT